MEISDRLCIWLSIAFEREARTAKYLLERYGSAEELRSAVLSGDTDSLNLSGQRIKRMKDTASESYIDDFIAMLDRNGVKALTLNDPAYPPLLKEIFDPPFVLYARGAAAAKLPPMTAAVVGTRRCSDYGQKVSFMMGQALAAHGVTVVSGLAYGCDSYAHEGALSVETADYPTIAVLGQGVLEDKKDCTRKTMEKILERGMVVSEYLPHSKVFSGSFPMRNRIISGICPATLVAEAGQKSGTMITVDCALEQGRSVFAVPGRITDNLNSGTNLMLQKGYAQPVYSTEDLINQLGLDFKSQDEEDQLEKITDRCQRKLYLILQKGERSFDSLLESTGLSVEELNMHLTDLEFSGLIKQLPGRFYAIA